MIKQEQLTVPLATEPTATSGIYSLKNTETFHIGSPEGDELRIPGTANTFDDIVAHSLADVDSAGDEIIAARERSGVQTVESKEKLSLRKRIGAKLGAFASHIDSVTAVASMKVMTGAFSGAQRAYGAYRAPLDKMEAKDGDNKAKKVGKFMGRAAYRLVVGAGIATASLMTKNMADAANITINGHNGGASNAFNDTVAHSTIGAGKKNAPVHWTAEMGDLPFFSGENLSTLDSTNEGAARIAEVVAQNPGKNTLLGYSEGSIALVKFLQDNPNYLKDGNSAVFVGTPYLPGARMKDNSFVDALSQLVPDTSRVLDYKTPGGENVTYIVGEDDFVKLKENPIGMLASLDPKGHVYTSADLSGQTPHITIHNADGSTSHILTETHTKLADGKNAKSGISAALVENNGMYVSRKADNFFEAADGDPLTGNVNMKDVVSTGAAAADEALPGSGAVINQFASTPGVTEGLQQAADTYMSTQSNVVGSFAETIQNNPQVSQVVEQAVPMVQQAAQNIAPQVNDAANAVQQAAPQFTPQINQVKGFFGIK